MKRFFTLLFLFGCIGILNAQMLTGVWRGKFEQNSLDYGSSSFSTETYKYEVQINNLETNALEGVTYSYLTTVFYGKAALKGIFNSKKNTLTIKETIMLDIKATGRTEPCLMTCYLDYKKIGKLEILTGTYTSVNARNKSDCGNGTVYLERVKDSEFEKEKFLYKNKTETSKAETKLPTTKTTIKPKSIAPVPNTSKISNKPKDKTKTTVVPKKVETISTTKAVIPKERKKVIVKQPKTIKESAKEYLVKKDKKINDDTVIVAKEVIEKPNENIVLEQKKVEAIQKPLEKVKSIPEPESDVLIQRENKLVTTIVVNSKEVILAFYDNGEIDNDIISVYKDNKLVIDKKTLSTNPIRLTLNFDDENTFYEVITVAENLGEIPPNTALMVVNYGNKRNEVSLSSDEKTNAKIIVKYVP